MAERVLVIGGTGPTGIPLVRGLVDAGHDVTILHRGQHERAETPAAGPPPPPRPVRRGRPPDRARRRAPSTSSSRCTGGCGRSRGSRPARWAAFVSVGGVPAYRGWMNPWLYDPPGLPVPVARGRARGDGGRARTRRGTASSAPRRRCSSTIPTRRTSATRTCTARTSSRRESGRSCGACSTAETRLVVADDGLTLAPPRLHREPRPRRAARGRSAPTRRPGRSSTSATKRCCPSVRSSRSSRARSGTEFEIVSMPYDLAVPARPLLAQPLPTHRVLDLDERSSRPRLPRRACPAREALARDGALARRAPARARAAWRRRCSPTRSTTRPRTG